MKLQDKLLLLHSQGITPKAVVYARFSSDNQRDESIDAQLRSAREFAKNNGIAIIHEYVDRAKSATTDDREQFQAMIKASASGDFHFVLVNKYDRFARNRADSIGYRLELKRNDVNLISVLESFDNETPEGALLEGILESMNEFYSRNLAREVMKGLKENAYRAMHNGGIPPYGYDVDPKTKKYIINEVEATGVKLIFSMILQHYSYNDVIKALDQSGFKTKLGGSFKHNSIHDILCNPRYIGLYTYMRRTPKSKINSKRNNHKYNPDEMIIKVPNGMPAIITEAEFKEVQAILNSRVNAHYNRRNPECLLSSKVVCGECGSPYCADRVKRKNGIDYYVAYRCNKKRSTDKCTNPRVARDYIDAKVLTLLADMLFDEALIPRLESQYTIALRNRANKSADILAALESEIKDKDKSIKMILKNLERTESETLLQHLVALEAEKKELMDKMSTLKSGSQIPSVNVTRLQEVLDEAKTLFLNENTESRKRLIDAFVDKVIVYRDKIEVKLNPTPFITNADYTKQTTTLPRK